MTDETKGDGMTLEQVFRDLQEGKLVTPEIRQLLIAHLAAQSATRSVRERNGEEYLVESARFDPDHAASPLFNDVRAYEVTHPDGRVQLIPNDPEMVEILKQSGRQVVPLQSAMRVDDARPPREWVEAAYVAFLRINDDDSDKAKTDLGTWAIGTHAALQAAIGGKE